jgi:hypothetical protein
LPPVEKTTWRQQGYKTRYKRVLLPLNQIKRSLFFGETSAKLENDAN